MNKVNLNKYANYCSLSLDNGGKQCNKMEFEMILLLIMVPVVTSINWDPDDPWFEFPNLENNQKDQRMIQTKLDELLLHIKRLTKNGENGKPNRDPDFESQFEVNIPDPDDIEAAKKWLVKYNEEAKIEWPIPVYAQFNYTTDLTDAKKQIMVDAKARFAAFEKRSSEAAQRFNWRNFRQQDETVYRLFHKISDIGTSILSDDEVNEVNKLIADMATTYSVATVYNRPGAEPQQGFQLDPGLTKVMASSTNWDDLLWAWQGWRNESGAKMPDMYSRYVELLNKAAVENDFPDWGAYWRSLYEDPNFEADCLRLWNEVRPLYEQMHAYTRRKLQERYQNNEFPETGHIPAHITGDMWAQTWEFLESMSRPYPNKTGVDATDEMVRQGYTPVKMVEVSEEFFTSIGLSPMPEGFYEKSLFVKPDDREIECHAWAIDFYNGKDFRIRQCTEVNMAWLVVTHHEMGHVAYFQAYKDQPIKFRDGANLAFHEAIGDLLALSVSTPKHLEKIGLLNNFDEQDQELQMNFLMQQGLFRIAFMPFGFLVDQWRWGVYSGRITKENYNKEWWNLRCQLQGISPPVQRTKDDFDPGAKFHIPAHVSYMKYFRAFILQYQFHKRLCEVAGQSGPLYTCDIYQSKEAGKVLEDVMKLGSSIHWKDALEMFTGSREVSAESFLEYFQPLHRWLEKQNAGQPVGWDENCPEGMVA